MDLVVARGRGEPIDLAAFDRRLASAVTEVIKQQIECDLDIVNDGELSKPNFTDYLLDEDFMGSDLADLGPKSPARRST
jgi:5-methyltetrahydropteroyltriglutamate--homocysteine methyltransferase